ncbi:MAG TPA: hypothetical protein VLF43_01725 [Candidatus Saccharimonadales bacterium]|nr:hypothetical protein [Candidatus Saccharimonadales bacterium]
MDFSNRNAQAAPAPAAPAAGPSGGGKKNKASGKDWGRIGGFVAVVAVAILLVATIVAVSTSSSSIPKEEKYVDSTKLQAVFLNTGQVYFGKIKQLNSKYFVVSNIYYLQTSGGAASGTAAAANTSVSLVKLGCELHEPYDQMVINRDQVTFWENLQDNGQVAQAVKTFVKQNPSGQKCADQSSSAGTNSSNKVQSATPNSGSGSTSTNP